MDESFGYTINNKKFITLPYADDFCLITTNKRTHQRLMDKINNNITTMGMKLKPSKCRTFSISSGTPSITDFFIAQDRIPSISEEEQKFLGKLLFFRGKAEDTFNHIKETFEKQLDNIDNLAVRSEYKLWIYKNYFLPANRFLLTVHDITETHLKKLDTLTDKRVKKWAGLPPCATNALLHLPSGLDLKCILQLYTEAHIISHTRTRLQADSDVNHVLNSRVERESQYTRKKCITPIAEEEYLKALSRNTVQQEIPDFDYENGERDQHKFFNDIREEVKSSLYCTNKEKWTEHVKGLVQQGKFLELASAEHEDAIWKSYIFDMKLGTMKFLLNAAIDTLPTGANLFKWNKKTNDRCVLCKCKETTSHILNCCRVSLEMGKFLWRHNNVINYLVSSVDTAKFKIFADLPGHTVDGGTIPADICITAHKPDIVIIDQKSNSIYIIELTVPIGHNIEVRHKEKSDKYAHFLTDIQNMNTFVICFEIGSRGYISTRNNNSLNTLHNFVKPGIKLKIFKQNISSLSVYSSYHIFNCRKDPVWSSPNYLLPPFNDNK